MINSSVDILRDFDMFFYYGQNKLELETKSDLMQNLMQSKRSLFYNRALDSSGIKDYENMPEGLTLSINAPYSIVKSLSRRNQFVSNGEGDLPDRRVAVSQSTIRIEISNTGEVRMTVLYIPLADFKETQTLQLGQGVIQ